MAYFYANLWLFFWLFCCFLGGHVVYKCLKLRLSYPQPLPRQAGFTEGKGVLFEVTMYFGLLVFWIVRFLDCWYFGILVFCTCRHLDLRITIFELRFMNYDFLIIGFQPKIVLPQPKRAMLLN